MRPVTHVTTLKVGFRASDPLEIRARIPALHSIRCIKVRFGLQEVLRQEWIHHPIGGIQLPPDFLEEVEAAAECLAGVVRLHTSCLIKER